MEPKKNSKKFWVMIGVFAAFIFLIAASLLWKNYWSPEAKSLRATQENYAKATKALNEFEAAMRADTYGGKTPEETLQMFIDALKKGDVELASKYFMLETNTQDPNYLTRKKWEEGLRKVRENGNLTEIITILEKAEPDPAAAINKDYYVFSARNEKRLVIVDVDLFFNKYSGVWKIQSL